MSNGFFTRIRRLLGPGLVTGAADDDPSGIATYSQAGAAFGFALLWTTFLTWPFMVAIQLVSARIGRVTGRGVIRNLATVAPRPLVLTLVGLLVVANTINIAADIAAMGETLRLVAGGPAHLYALGFGLFCAGLEVFMPYRRYAPVLKAMTLVLFVYVVAAFTLKIDWGAALLATLAPKIEWSRDYILMIVAVFGTTISPYLFFWQADQEVEELRLARKAPLRARPAGGDRQLARIGFDTGFGMAASNLVAFFIMITAAAALHANGVTDIDSAARAAEALRPLAGEFAFLLFALGIVGTGLLAVPVLAGSTGYAVAEAFAWRSTLEARPERARGFYAVIAASTLGGALLGFVGFDPMRMLVWAAVINGIVAVPVMIAMMKIVTDRREMGDFVAHPLLRVGGWLATALMACAALALLVSFA